MYSYCYVCSVLCILFHCVVLCIVCLFVCVCVCVCVCTVLLPPGVNPTAVNKYISYHTTYHIKLILRGDIRAFEHEKDGPQNVKILCGKTYTEEKETTQSGGCSFEGIRFRTAYKEYKSNTPNFD